jgi:hypothetical protein
MVAGRPVAECPGQLLAPRRGVDRVNGPHGMGGPDGTVKQRGTQRRHQPRHPRPGHALPSLVVNGPREVPDPLRETVVRAEGLPPLKAGRRHRCDPRAACLGEPACPAVDVASAVQCGQRFTSHSAVIDEAIWQLEAGGRDPLVRLVQGRGGVAHNVLILRRIRPCQSHCPSRSGDEDLHDLSSRVALHR